MGIFSQKFENPKPRFPEGKIPEPEKTRSQKPDLDPDPEMSTPNPPRPRLLLPDYITTSGSQCSRIAAEKQNIHLKQVWIWRIHLKKYHGTKWLCVLPKQHGLNCSQDCEHCTDFQIMEQVPKFNISIIMAKKRTLMYFVFK